LAESLNFGTILQVQTALMIIGFAGKV
jgi:hypothetical protein